MVKTRSNANTSGQGEPRDTPRRTGRGKKRRSTSPPPALHHTPRRAGFQKGGSRGKRARFSPREDHAEERAVEDGIEAEAQDRGIRSWIQHPSDLDSAHSTPSPARSPSNHAPSPMPDPGSPSNTHVNQSNPNKNGHGYRGDGDAAVVAGDPDPLTSLFIEHPSEVSSVQLTLLSSPGSGVVGAAPTSSRRAGIAWDEEAYHEYIRTIIAHPSRLHSIHDPQSGDESNKVDTAICPPHLNDDSGETIEPTAFDDNGGDEDVEDVDGGHKGEGRGDGAGGAKETRSIFQNVLGWFRPATSSSASSSTPTAGRPKHQPVQDQQPPTSRGQRENPPSAQNPIPNRGGGPTVSDSPGTHGQENSITPSGDETVGGDAEIARAYAAGVQLDFSSLMPPDQRLERTCSDLLSNLSSPDFLGAHQIHQHLPPPALGGVGATGFHGLGMGDPADQSHELLDLMSYSTPSSLETMLLAEGRMTRALVREHAQRDSRDTTRILREIEDLRVNMRAEMRRLDTRERTGGRAL